jgi:hypothetical protein
MSEINFWDSFYVIVGSVSVRCYDAYRAKALAACGGGRRRICHADDHSFQQRVALVRAPNGSVASIFVRIHNAWDSIAYRVFTRRPDVDADRR